MLYHWVTIFGFDLTTCFMLSQDDQDKFHVKLAAVSVNGKKRNYEDWIKSRQSRSL